MRAVAINHGPILQHDATAAVRAAISCLIMTSLLQFFQLSCSVQGTTSRISSFPFTTIICSFFTDMKLRSTIIVVE